MAVSDRRAVLSWVLYDFANSPFTTLVITFVYGTYFTQAIAANEVEGTVLWARGVTVTALIVAFCAPVLGALADRGGLRKRFLVLSTLVAATATAGLFWVEPGQVLPALLLVVVANIAFEIGIVFYNAFLPDVSTPRTIGTVSGWGWGVGYIGGLLALVLALVGFIQAEPPWFGFSAVNGENIRATNLLVAAWFVVFSIPFFLFVREAPVARTGNLIASSYKQLVDTIREIRRHRQTARFLLARLVYNDALVTIFAFGGIYAAGTFGFTIEEVLVFGIVLNVASGAGAIAMGYIEDHLGAKRTIILSLCGLLTASAIAVLATGKPAFWAAGVILGLFVGPNQSSSRSLMGRLAPADMRNEFFGFFALSGKLTAFIGPALLLKLTEVSGSQRVGVSVVLVMFAVGLVLLLPVRVDGRRESGTAT